MRAPILCAQCASYQLILQSSCIQVQLGWPNIYVEAYSHVVWL